VLDVPERLLAIADEVIEAVLFCGGGPLCAIRVLTTCRDDPLLVPFRGEANIGPAICSKR
jgi:hypothetical protein